MDYEKKYKQLHTLISDLYPFMSEYCKEKVEGFFPELKESEDEKIRGAIIHFISHTPTIPKGVINKETMIAWLEKQGESYTKRDVDDAWLKGMCDAKRELEKQGEQKPTQEIEPFEAEHGKYYYCIKDYFCGGRKQASKGDVVQALRGLPIMGLKDAGEYFLPVNSIKCNSAWSEEDEIGLSDALWAIKQARTVVKDENDMGTLWYAEHWLKSLKPQNRWKPSDEQMEALKNAIHIKPFENPSDSILWRLYEQLKKLKE